jgi:DNA-3-methyladenine glycosylase
LTLAAHHAGDPPSRRRPTSPVLLEPLTPADLGGPVFDVARRLLGALIVRQDDEGLRIARIVETEAYGGPEDRASHARAGRTARTSVMFGPPGRAYVYLVYGRHHCLNVVCGVDGEAAAVLIRAALPVAGVERMRRARGLATDGDATLVTPGDHRLAAGPARLCQALGIDRSLDGLDLLADERLRLAMPAALHGVEPGDHPGPRAERDEPAPRPEMRDHLAPGETVLSGPRVGVSYAGPEWAGRPWRFGIADDPSLSRPFPAVA